MHRLDDPRPEWARQSELWRRQAPSESVFHIIGPYNTGTNFVYHLLNANKIPHTPTPRHPITHKALFKHYPFDVAKRIAGTLSIDTTDLVFLIMVRSPYKWLDSLRKSPYEFHFDDYASPCRIDLAAINHDENYADHLSSVLPGEDAGALFSFTNVVEYWNRFYRDYLSASDSNRISALFLRYEDLVEFTPESIDLLRARIGLPTIEEFRIPAGPSKKHGSASGYLEARARLDRTPTFSPREREAIDAHLSPPLCRRMGYAIQ